MRFPFEVSYEQIRSDPDAYVDAVFGSLQSEFMVMPRGKGFVEFSTFEADLIMPPSSEMHLLPLLRTARSCPAAGRRASPPARPD